MNSNISCMAKKLGSPDKNWGGFLNTESLPKVCNYCQGPKILKIHYRSRPMPVINAMLHFYCIPLIVKSGGFRCVSGPCVDT